MAVFLLGVDGAAAVFEIVQILAHLGRLAPHPRVLDAAEVDVHMAVLVAEDRREIQVPAAPAVGPALVIAGGPFVPDIDRNRMGRAADGQQQHEHALVIDVPVRRDEAALRMPAHGDPVVAHDGPVPFDPLVQGLDPAADLDLVRVVAVEIAGGEQHAGHQQGRVDGRQLVGPVAVTGLHIEEMIEEALVPRRAGRLRPLGQAVEIADGDQDPLARLVPAHPAALDADGPAGQGETDRGDGAEGFAGPAIGRQAGGPVRDLFEPAEGAFLKLIDLAVQPQRPALRAVDRPSDRLLRRRLAHNEAPDRQGRSPCRGSHQEVSAVHRHAH